jgi:hypothetical protein
MDVQLLSEAKDDLPQEPQAFVDSHVAVEESVEPSMIETSVVSEPATVPLVAPEDLQIKDDGIAQTGEDLAGPPPPTDSSIQEEAVAPPAGFKETVETSSAVEPSVVEIASVVVSEPATVVPEGLQIEHGDIAQIEEVSSPLTDNPVQEEAIIPTIGFQEAAEISEPVAEIVSVVPEPSVEVPEDLSIDNDGIPQAEGDLAPEILQSELRNPASMEGSQVETAAVVPSRQAITEAKTDSIEEVNTEVSQALPNDR